MARILRAASLHERRIASLTLGEPRPSAEPDPQALQENQATMEAAWRSALEEERGRVLSEAEGQASHLLAGALELQRDLWAQAQQHLVGVVQSALERLIGESLEERPDRILFVLRPLLERAAENSRLSLRLNPLDALHVRSQLEQAQVEILDDPEIERGGCIAEGPSGSIDARLSVRLEALLSALRAEEPA